DHRGQRAPGPGQPRAAAHRRAVHRPFVSAHRERTKFSHRIMIKTEIDRDYVIDVLLRLLHTPSPSGYTDRVVQLVCDELDRMDVPYEMPRRGAIRANLAGRHSSPDRAVVAHIDTLGAMVKALKPNGRVEVVPVGHWNARFAEGARVTLFTDLGFHRGT